MNLNDWPAWITIIVAIAVPAITSLLTMKHQEKIKKIEILYEKEFAAYCDFVEKYGHLKDNGTYDAFWEFLSAAYKASIIADTAPAKEIVKLIAMVQESEMEITNEINGQFGKCLGLLNQSIHQGEKI